MTTPSVKCDQCGKELVVYTQYPSRTGLRLTEVDYNINTTGVQYLISMPKQIDTDKDFCDINCLREWCVSKQ